MFRILFEYIENCTYMKYVIYSKYSSCVAFELRLLTIAFLFGMTLCQFQEAHTEYIIIKRRE
jgi:hypothetical protein